MFFVMFWAMNVMTGSGSAHFRLAAFERRIAIRVSQVGRLDVGRQAPLEARDQAGLELLDLAGAPVARQDDLLSGLEQVVEGVEELLLDALLAGEELDVVEQHDVGVAVALAELDHPVLLQRLDEVVRELLGREVGDARVRVVAQDGVPDGVHQVGLAEAGVAVDEQGVVGLGGGLGHRQRRGVRHLVVGPDDKGLERVAGVEGSGRRAPVVAPDGPARPPARALGGRRRGARRRGALPDAARRPVGLLQVDAHRPAGGQAQALRDQVQVVVVDPDGGEIVGHAERDRVLRGLEANHGLKPHLEDVLGKEGLEVTFDRFPQIMGQGQRGHGRAESLVLFTLRPRERLRHVIRSRLRVRSLRQNCILPSVIGVVG